MSGECQKCHEHCLDCKCEVACPRKYVSKEEAKKMFPSQEKIDEEDVIECTCYMVICLANDKRLFTDRVYRDFYLAQKRIKYLNALSDGRGQWFVTHSELGK